ncbi:hypothetical protein SAMN05216267_1003113 [Actinacidiphila rubida]|uniref:Secreted protein n=1 Tax=Actinacidiphila rubida TaxID=310780 RepID=A0A1H8F3F1_9ACTN|nr:hypothetical protein [Actinacidiphila rubida]SEN26166.1 hypothetical protein SAMN05216267_1003113 [Actinacidiphila rubida]
METAGIIALLFFLIFATLATVATVRTVRAVKRHVSRGTAQARRVVEDSRIKARRFTPGTPGELARLRLGLRTSLDSTYRALEAGRAGDASLSEAAQLLGRLDAHARELDSEMRLLDGEPDRARVAARLPELTERTRRITHSADSLRWAAQDRARHLADDDLAALRRDIAVEAGALRHWEPPQDAPASDDPPRPDALGGPDAKGTRWGRRPGLASPGD